MFLISQVFLLVTRCGIRCHDLIGTTTPSVYESMVSCCHLLTLVTSTLTHSHAPTMCMGWYTQHKHGITALDVARGGGKPLLATGGLSSEIYIWDLSRPDTALIPGTPTGTPDTVSGLAWNVYAPHMLAVTGPIKQTELWDLRSAKPTFACRDEAGRMRCSAVAWNDASGGVQIFASSDNPDFAAVQLWDFRMPTKPISEVIAHQDGMLLLLLLLLCVCGCVCVWRLVSCCTVPVFGVCVHVHTWQYTCDDNDW